MGYWSDHEARAVTHGRPRTARALRDAAAVFLASLALCGCQTTTSGGTVGTDRRQLLLVSSQELNQLAAQSYAKLLSESSRKGLLNQDSGMLERVREIAGRLEPQTKVFRADAPGWKWEVNVISGKEPNAFCMPGGKIVVYSALVDKLNLTDDEIAIVLGHEIAHALREHSREQVSQALAAQLAIGVGTSLLGLGGLSSTAANVGYEALIATRFSRNDESEADRIGLELAARSGYDPRAGVTFWRKLIDSTDGGRSPEFLSTHPTQASRIEEIQRLLPTVMPLYDAAKRRGN